MSSVQLTLSDNIVILGYFAVVLGVGLYTRRFQTDAGEYFAGGHQVPWSLAGISHYMSGFSAFTFVVYSEIAYRYGLVAILLYWTSVPACLLGGRFFAARWRRARVITPVEFLEQRCGLGIRQLFAWAAIPAKVFEDALKLFTTAIFFSASIHIGMSTAIVACGAIVVLYTLLGGLLALIVTDYIQFLMKSLAILLLLPMAIWRSGGVRAAVHSIPQALLHWTAGPYGWTYVAGYAVLVLMSYNASWAFAQKYYSVPDEASAQKVGYLAAALNFVGTPIMLLPAILGRTLLPNLEATHQTSQAYVLLVFFLLPAGMIGVIVAALFSATMATVSSDLNAIASVLTKDVWQRMLRPRASDREQLYVGRMMTGLLGVIIVLLSLWIAASNSASLFELMVTAFGVFLAPTLLPMLALLCWRRLHSASVYAGFAAGLASGIGTLVVRNILNRSLTDPTGQIGLRIEGICILMNTLVTCLAMAVTAYAIRPGAEEDARRRVFFQMLDTPLAPQQSTGIAHPAPERNAAPLIAVCTIIVGLLLVTAGALAKNPTAHILDLCIGFGFTLFSLYRLRRALFHVRRQTHS